MRNTTPDWTARASALVCAVAFGAALCVPPSAFAEETATVTAPLIVIDPGHGGRYSNANANGLKEKYVNLLVARALRDQLLARGYRVLMTRETDRAVQLGDVHTWNYRSRDGSWHYRVDGRVGHDGGIPEDDLQARAEIANKAGADLFICVHSNGSRSRRTRGFETYASKRDALGRSLSYYVQDSVVAGTGLRDRGAKTRDFYVCRWTNMPAILVETAFITNPSDARLLKKSSFRARIARGIADGVDEWMATSPYRRVLSRIEGDTPSSLGAAVSSQDFPSGAPAVVLAQQESWTDAPGAVTLAKSLGAPLLWADRSGVTSATAAELKRLAPQRIVMVGTAAALVSLPTTQVAEASALATSAVSVVSAVDASALSASIAATVGVGLSGAVFIASSSAPRDLLAAAPAAATMDAPLLVATNGALAPEAMAFLAENRQSIRRVYLVGSTTSVPGRLANGYPAVRYSARSLSALAGLLNDARFTDRTRNSLRPVVADARYEPEYLSSAVRAARLRVPLIPAEGSVLPPKSREWITNRRSVIRTFEVHDARGGSPNLMDHLLRKVDYL